MAKGGKKRSRVGGSTATGGGGGATTSAATANWSAADHAARHGKASQTPARVDRTAWLTHDTREKREGMKLQLHVKQTKRQVEVLRKRLQRWDPVEEKIAADQKKQKEEAAEAERLRVEEESLLPASQKRVRRRRAGPETWKLRGAARPAHEVYDFDVRYECPHVLAHTEAAAQAGRVQNLLQSHNANNTLWFDPHGIPECREYLGLLMQLGHVCQEAKQYKSAREAWLECVALDGGSNNNDNSATNEGEPLTSARDALMRLYMQLHKYKDAYKLGTEFKNDPSVWIRYHAALAACQLDHEDQQQCMVEAVRSNIFCANYLVHYKDTFSKVMEYTEELEDAETEPQSSLEEAIEYCGKGADSAISLWQQNSKALDVLRGVLQSKLLSVEDLDWSGRLKKIEDEFRLRNNHTEEEQEEANYVDLGMYAGQFRIAMEMLGDAGDLSVKVSTTR